MQLTLASVVTLLPRALFLVIILSQVAAAVRRFKTLDGLPPELYAHRGESTLAPANTLASFELAAILGADFIEPDLQLTKDGILVCHHNFGLKEPTDVASQAEFQHLRSSFSGILGREQVKLVDDWFIPDFTLTQLKTLRVRQEPHGIRPQTFNSLFEIPTFAEFLELVHKMSVKLNKRLGIIPELKTPEYYNSIDNQSAHYMEDQFLRTLTKFGYPTKTSPQSRCMGRSDLQLNRNGDLSSVRIECPRVRVQSFEEETLAYLQSRLDFDTILLLGDNDSVQKYLSDDGLKYVAEQGIKELGVWKGFLASDIMYHNSTNAVSQLPAVCHEHGLRMSIYTLKDSREEDSKANIMNRFMDLGIDAMFVENIAESREIRTQYE